MFERFTTAARRVLVLAQEEARLLGHGFIGTEHVLLGLLQEGEGVAADALGSLGVTLDGARHAVRSTVDSSSSAGPGTGTGTSGPAPTGSARPPFTPRTKKVLELSLREALERGDHEIGTEHLLLGILREGEGVACQVLSVLGASPERVRAAVAARTGRSEARASGPSSGIPGAAPAGQALRRRIAGPATVVRPGLPRPRTPSGDLTDRCALCERDLWEAAHVVVAGSVQVCDACVRASNELLDRAAPEDRQLHVPPRVAGDVPDDDSVSAIVAAVSGTFAPAPGVRCWEVGADGDDLLRGVLEQAAQRHGIRPAHTRVTGIRFLMPDLADVRLKLAVTWQADEIAFDARLRRIEGRWLVTRGTVGEILGRLGTEVPPGHAA